MAAKAFSVALVAMFLLLIFAGCINDKKVTDLTQNSETTKGIQDKQIQKPEKFTLEKITLQDKKRIVLSEENYKAVPILAPVFKNCGIDVSVNWDKGDGVKIDASDLSKFSSQVAVTFWNTSDKAIVVDTYENALLAGPLAVILNAPILYSGDTTNEALWKIGATKYAKIITIGNTHYSKDAGVSLKSQDEVLGYTIAEGKKKGTNLSYVAVVNPNDNVSNAFYTAHLSCLGSMLAAYRIGLIIATNGSAEQTSILINTTKKMLECNGMRLKFICIIGDYAAIEPGGSLICAILEEYEGENPCPSDNAYANFDENELTIECAMGRVIAKSLCNMSCYLDRIIHYQTHLSKTSKDGSPNPIVLGSDWNNNALTYVGVWTERMALGGTTATNNMFRDSFFNTCDDTMQAHTGVKYFVDEQTGDTISANLICSDIAKSNYILMCDHGSPVDCNSFDSGDIMEMPPNVFFGASCSLGRIDFEKCASGTDKETSMAYTFLQKGSAACFLGVRTTFGQTGEIPDSPIYPYESQGICGNIGLGYLTFRHLLNENCTVGEALLNAKNQFLLEKSNVIASTWNGQSEEDMRESMCWSYQLYGDPAFNPYEPCNEGKST